jgi:hypothetical protein
MMKATNNKLEHKDYQLPKVCYILLLVVKKHYVDLATQV